MNKSEPAANKLYDLVTQQILSKVILLAAELEFDKKLSNKTTTIEGLAKQCQFNHQAMLRFLRVLEAYEIVEINKDLVSPGSLCEALEEIRGPHLIHGHKIMEFLPNALTTNQECYSNAFGMTFSDMVANDTKELAKLKDWSEKSAHKWLLPALMDQFDFSTFDALVEIGGWGHLKRKFSVMWPDKPSFHVTFDSPLEHHQSIPDKSTTLYVFLRSLLALNDEQIVETLQKLPHSTQTKGLIVDFLIPPKSHPRYQRSTIADINILTCLNGKLRTYDEWEAVVKKAGLKINNFLIVPTKPAYMEPILPLFLMEF